MSETNKQNQYEEQDQDANQEIFSETKKNCADCLVSYVKWSFKCAIDLCCGIAHCM